MRSLDYVILDYFMPTEIHGISCMLSFFKSKEKFNLKTKLIILTSASLKEIHILKEYFNLCVLKKPLILSELDLAIQLMKRKLKKNKENKFEILDKFILNNSNIKTIKLKPTSQLLQFNKIKPLHLKRSKIKESLQRENSKRKIDIKIPLISCKLPKLPQTLKKFNRSLNKKKRNQNIWNMLTPW